MTQPPERGARLTASFRERHRAGMRRSFLDAALRVVADEGEPALSMKRLTKELRCSVGLVYQYFPSKSDLVAAVRQEQLRPVHDWFERSNERAARLVTQAQDSGPAMAALAELIGLGRSWAQAGPRFPVEVTLLRRLVTELDHAAKDSAPSAGAPFFDGLVAAVSNAADSRALTPGDSTFRAQMIIGVVTAPGLERRGGAPADGDRTQLGLRLLDCLLTAWGADPRRLEQLEWAFGVAEARQ